MRCHTEGCEMDQDELQEDVEYCRRCGGTGFVPAGQSAATFIGLALLIAFEGACFLVLGLGIGHWCL